MRSMIRAMSAVAVGLLAVGATTASAVVGGQPDGNRNPNVGMIVASDAIGPLLICTGTLVTPTVVLTAAHCAQPAIAPYGPLTYTVTFNTSVALDGNGFPVLPADGIAGTPDPHPDYNNDIRSKSGVGTAAFQAQTALDIGIVRLSRPAATGFPGITPATIVSPSSLDQFKNGDPKPDVLQVGYGDNRVGPPGQATSAFLPGFRNQSVFPLSNVRESILIGNANPNNNNGYGMPASGDSGSPWFVNGTVSAVTSYSAVNNKTGGPRLDTGAARDFLRSRGLVP